MLFLIVNEITGERTECLLQHIRELEVASQVCKPLLL
jgi:hypothetical protein